jgi:site-specific DNA-methyltransferase (adenine-specific)
MSNITLLKGDSRDILKSLEDNSVDSVVCDPPYAIGFMGKGWDSGDDNVANDASFWKEVLRVLKPGGHLLSFSHSRTYHRQAVAVEDAGFEIRDQIMWIYGSGFPKSHDIGKNIEKIKVGGKANLTQVGTKKGLVATNHNDKAKTSNPSGFSYRTNKKGYSEVATDRTQVNGEIPVYEITNDYKGWGTALKPAHEPIVMARKPFKGTVADNVLEWGTGGINVDGCRVGNEVRTTPIHSTDVKEDNTLFGLHPTIQHERVETTEGRFPANIIFDEEAGKILDEQSGIRKTGDIKPYISKDDGIFGTMKNKLHINSFKGDTGGASRFFYCPKASKKDRNDGVEHLEVKRPDTRTDTGMGSFTQKGVQPQHNSHPTVKPTDLMAYLIRLVTPKGGVVLDPFMGSGSTGKAAVREGMNFIGIERETEYMEIAKSRIDYELKKNKHTEFFNI